MMLVPVLSTLATGAFSTTLSALFISTSAGRASGAISTSGAVSAAGAVSAGGAVSASYSIKKWC